MTDVAAAGAEAGGAAVPLAAGLELRCDMRELDGSLDVALHHHARPVATATLHPASPRHGFRHRGDLVDLDFALEIDPARAEIRATGIAKVRDPVGDRWHALLDVDGASLARYAPAHGAVGDRTEPDPPVVDHPRFGRCQGSAKNVTRLFVDDEHRLLTDVGRTVKHVMFPEHPPFVFNTVACVGALDADGYGGYPDPTSPWFNVFDGYYQIDVAKREWGRPFGYRTAAGARSEVEFEDLVRLGKSDWNWFSNWMYGVPAEHAEACSAIDMSTVDSEQADAGTVGETRWHLATVRNVEFVSAYEADHPDAATLVRNTLLTPVWRRSYGRPRPRPEWTQSFFPTRRDAQLLMSYWEDDESFHTAMFGGTAAPDAPPGFLEAQMAACRAVIERSYPALGFPAG